MSATTGGPAFPCEVSGDQGEHQTGNQLWMQYGMTLHDYAAIHFSAAWTVALGSKEMSESHREQAWEANRLGRMQADDFMIQRSLASQPDTEKK